MATATAVLEPEVEVEVEYRPGKVKVSKKKKRSLSKRFKRTLKKYGRKTGLVAKKTKRKAARAVEKSIGVAKDVGSWAKRTIKRGFAATVFFAKRARVVITDASIRAWSYAVVGTKIAGHYAMRGLGYVGAAFSGAGRWIISAAAVVVSFIGLGEILLIVGVITMFGFTYRYWNDYVFESFRWMSKKNRGSYRQYIHTKKEARKAAEAAADAAVETIEMEESIEDDISDEKVKEVAERFYLFGMIPRQDPDFSLLENPRVRAKIDDLNRRAQESSEEIVKQPTLNVPGADFVITSDDDPHTSEGTSYTPRYKVILEMREAKIPPLEFDFSEYFDNKIELIAAFTWLRDSSNVKQERSYWEGRRRMLQAYVDDPENLDEHGRVWALAHTQLRNQQKTYVLKHVHLGLNDMVKELKAARIASRV